MVNYTLEFDHFLQKLFPLCRSITGPANRQTLEVLKEIIPLQIYEVPSGTTVYDWCIPDEWSIRSAWISDAYGQRLVDFNDNNLHVVSYSLPIYDVFNWDELIEHLHIHPTLPDAIPYRTSYYHQSWGFCVTHAQFDSIRNAQPPFTVLIDSSLNPGNLTLSDFLIPGISRREILVSTYFCHPSMANDNLSGLLLTCFLARHIVRHLTNKFTYRFVFVPETIGSIAYLSQRLDQNYSEIELGIVVTTVGGPGVYGYKQSYNQNHYINSIVEDTFHNLSVPFITYPFDIHGSDERQYSAPPYSINTISITRDKYYEYPYYHTSLDNLDFVKGSQINDSLQIYIQLIQNLEALDYPSRNFEACEPFLSKHGLYSSVGGSLIPNTKEYTSTDIILWLLFLSDGKTPTYSIAKILNLPLPLITEFVNMLRSKGILG